jgi:Predicted glutamine amidotransferase
MKILTIMNLYPNEMNIYGDHGNLLTLQKRAEWHGIKTEVICHEPGKKFDTDVDIVIGGGGQDSGQDKIQADLLKNADNLHKLSNDQTPMLVICGLYQLFGHYFETHDGRHIDGIGIFDAWTKAGPTRLIGNTIVENEFGETVGYENHSGLTYLNKNQKLFGKVTKGAGNNGVDGTEGARTNNAIGSYLHGPLLPKNPKIADELIRLAMIKKYSSFEPVKIDDSIANTARNISANRPR